MLTVNVNYVTVPKATVVIKGISRVFVVALKQRVWVVPHKIFGGSSASLVTTTFSVGGQSLIGAVERLLADPTTTVASFDAKLSQWLFAELELDPGHCLEIAALAEFRIKAGFFGKAISYQRPGDRGFRAIAFFGKAHALALQAFYQR